MRASKIAFLLVAVLLGTSACGGDDETFPRGGTNGSADIGSGGQQQPMLIEWRASLVATEVDASEDTAAGSESPTKKKRSRRGSRGGRKRKKPATNGGEAVAGAEEPETAEPTGDDEVAEYVPMSEWIEDFDATVVRAFEAPEVDAVPGWEPLRACAERIGAAYERLRGEHPTAPLVLVGHATAWTLLVAHLRRLPLDGSLVDRWRAWRMPDVVVLDA